MVALKWCSKAGCRWRWMFAGAGRTRAHEQEAKRFHLNPINLARWIHILAAAAWLGMVVTVVFVLVPAAMKLQEKERAAYIGETFPRVFRTASVLAVVTLAAGAWLNYLLTGWRDLDGFFFSGRGRMILAGGALGLALTLFHFFVEGRLEPNVRSLHGHVDKDRIERISRFLNIIPRFGLIVMLTIFILMMAGARGF